MNALDQAFIKAFTQQGRSTAAISTMSPKPAPATAPPDANRVGNIWAALERTPNERKTEGGIANAELGTGKWELGIEKAGKIQKKECGTAECVWEHTEREGRIGNGASVPLRCESWAVDRGPANAYIEPLAVGGWPLMECDTPNAEVEEKADKPLPISDVRQPPSDISRPRRQEFRPAWQVDRFSWPKVCRRLMARAAEEWDRLADAMLTANARGQKVLAFAGCRRGEGATTLLLCVARRLAERGIKAVLVDADLDRPRLAKRLGVQPQLGWDEIESGQYTTLDQAIVEATANNLALLAIHEPDAAEGHSPGKRTRLTQLTSWIPVLRDHYVMVLMDLGPLEDIESLGDRSFWAADRMLDGILLVHNRHVTSEERLSGIEQQLAATGLAVTGVIENCTVEPPSPSFV
jgi:Mrp family chromosome partitioning ATPase